MDLKRVDDWHVHLTVVARTPDVARTFGAACAKLGFKPIVMTNHSAPLSRPPYQELIPSTHVPRSELGAVIVAMHDAAKYWVMTDWTVVRHKIEGRDHSGDALYAESHLDVTGHILPVDFAASQSMLSGKQWATRRARLPMITRDKLLEGPRVEYCVYDSAPTQDDAWLRSWGALT